MKNNETNLKEVAQVKLDAYELTLNRDDMERLNDLKNTSIGECTDELMDLMLTLSETDVISAEDCVRYMSILRWYRRDYAFLGSLNIKRDNTAREPSAGKD